MQTYDDTHESLISLTANVTEWIFHIVSGLSVIFEQILYDALVSPCYLWT